MHAPQAPEEPPEKGKPQKKNTVIYQNCNRKSQMIINLKCEYRVPFRKLSILSYYYENCLTLSKSNLFKYDREIIGSFIVPK